MSVNNLVVVGHLGKDCTTNQVNGKQVINFSVCHSEKYKDQGGNLKETSTWFDCSYWSDSKVSDYLKKGTLVYVTGPVSLRTYAKQDGTTGAALQIRVFNVNLLAQPKEAATGPVAAYVPPTHTAASPAGLGEPIDDLPF